MNHDRRWLALPIILAATFMYGFDFNVVNVALPSLQRELHAGAAALELVTGGGLAAAAMVPQVLAMITALFPAQERPRALAWFGVTAGASGLCGQVAGGLLLSADVLGLGWRAIFLINIPVGVVVLALAARLVPGVATPARSENINFFGVITVDVEAELAKLGPAGWRPLRPVGLDLSLL